MQTEATEEISKTSELNLAFDWFDKTITDVISQGFENFWEKDFQIRLMSVTTSEHVKMDIFSANTSFFAHKAEVNKHQSVITRLSSDFVNKILTTFLKENDEKFAITNLTDLEIKILNRFSDELFKNIKDLFYPYKDLPKRVQADRLFYNLGFYVKWDELPASKIVISIPRNAFSPKSIELVDNFTNEDFLNSSIMTKILTGTSKITLNDLKNLDSGDIIILENSKTNNLKVKIGNVILPFKTTPNPLLFMDIEEENETKEGENRMTKNIWDNIPIEVSAEFHKVKMNLGELKKITSGMVVDLGSTFNNKISLVVDDKVVARGDLVIIKDRYGVKIDEIVHESKDNSISVDIQDTEPVKKQEVIRELSNEEDNQTEDEDFNYSDFEEDER